MKLLSCHVINFGKLSSFDYDFNEKTSVIIEKNGWGKTTFSQFIKAMFYSLPQTKARSLDDNPRKKYKPWNGGIFGGSISFETETGAYKIERTFGANENEDSFLLINSKTNKPSNDFSKNIGEELFGLDSESFIKTIYISETNISTQITDKISAKLNDFAQTKEDVSNFDNAIKIIDEKRKLFKRTGERGQFYDTKKQIEEINIKKQSISNIKKAIDDLESKIDNLQKQLTEQKTKEKVLNKKIEESAKHELLQNKHEHLLALKKENEDLQKSMQKLKTGFNNNIPTQEELEKAQKDAETTSILSKEISNMKNEIDALSTKLNNLNKFFNGAATNDDFYQKINQKYKKLQELQANMVTNATNSTKNNTKNAKLVVFVSTLAAISVLIATSVVLGIVGAIPLWLSVGLSVWFVACFVVILVFLKKINKRLKDNTSKNALFETCLTYTNEIETALNTFVWESEQPLYVKISIFNQKYGELNQTHDLLHAKQKELESKKSKMATQQNLLSQFAQAHNISFGTNLSVVILGLMKDLLNYEQQAATFSSNARKIKELESSVEPLPKDYLSVEQLVDLREATQKEIGELESTLLSDKNALESFIVKHDELLELDEREEELKNKLSQIAHKIKILEETEKFLFVAKDELDSTFLKPLASEFKKLAQSVQLENDNKFSIDTSLNISIEENGQTKDFAFLSTGYKDLAYICTRLAIINVMYKKEKPFIILDDPFINLDEEKFYLVKKVVDSWSNDYQFVYFACHKSRM